MCQPMTTKHQSVDVGTPEHKLLAGCFIHKSLFLIWGGMTSVGKLLHTTVVELVDPFAAMPNVCVQR